MNKLINQHFDQIIQKKSDKKNAKIEELEDELKQLDDEIEKTKQNKTISTEAKILEKENEVKNLKLELKTQVDKYNLEKNKALNYYTMENGLLVGNLTIKCKDNEIKTHTYILKYLHEDYDGLSLNFNNVVNQPFSPHNKKIVFDFSSFHSDTVKRLLRFLCEQRLRYCITWNDIMELFCIFERTLSKYITEQDTDWIYNTCINRELETYGDYLDGLKIISHCKNKYLMKMTNELINQHFETIKRFRDLHTKDKKCSCEKQKYASVYVYKNQCPYKTKCKFRSLPDECRKIINEKAEFWDKSAKHCHTSSCDSNNNLKLSTHNGLYYCDKHYTEQTKS